MYMWTLKKKKADFSEKTEWWLPEGGEEEWEM